MLLEQIELLTSAALEMIGAMQCLGTAFKGVHIWIVHVTLQISALEFPFTYAIITGWFIESFLKHSFPMLQQDIIAAGNTNRSSVSWVLTCS